MKRSFVFLLAILSPTLRAADWYAYAGASAAATTFSLYDGSPTGSNQDSTESQAATGTSSATATVTVSGTGNFGSGTSTTSVGVIHASTNSNASEVETEVGGKRYMGSVGDASGRWFDTLTVLTGGFLQISWDVTGSGSGVFSGGGRFSVQRPDFSQIGVIDFFPRVGSGEPLFQINGGAPGSTNSFYAYVNPGDKLLLAANLELKSYGGNGAPGGGSLDYSHSAYALVQDAFGSGTTFTSASGYRYGVAAVPEPASLAALGLGVLGILKRPKKA
jgi:hypothetical protein